MNKIIILLFLLVLFILLFLSHKKTDLFTEYFSTNNNIKVINKNEASNVIRSIKTFNKYTKTDKNLLKSTDLVAQEILDSFSIIILISKFL